MVVIARHRALVSQRQLATVEGAKAFQGTFVKQLRGRRDILRIQAHDETGRELVLYLKRYWRRPKKDGLKSLLLFGRVWSIARQEWENARALEQAGFTVSRSVAYGEDCGWCWERFSFLLTEAAPGQQTVDQFLDSCLDRAPRREVIGALAIEVRRLHDAGLSFPDLFTRHIFVDSSPNPPRFCFIDVARLDRRARISDRRRSRDLAALNATASTRSVTPKERLLFLRTYAGAVDRGWVRRIRRRMSHLLRRRKYRKAFGLDIGCHDDPTRS